MEELSDNNYTKSTDAVERYLLNLVQEYFKTTNVASTTSREYIIKKAVERMREEISFDSIGVLSITLPSGETRTGAVNISLEDLNGEPFISPKLSAFNVNFGEEANTACEGNDPRLSDARKPLSHEHDIADINGLEGILSSLTGKAEKTGALVHSHNNLDVLDILIYTGDKEVIDLTELETLEDKVKSLCDETKNEIIQYKEETNTKITEIDKKLIEINNKIEEAKKEVGDNKNTNKEYYELSKKYTDESFESAKNEINALIDDLVTKSMLNEIMAKLTDVYTLVGTMEVKLNSVIDFDLHEKQKSIIDISSDIITELNNRSQAFNDCQIEVFIKYSDEATGKETLGTLPYIIFNNDAVDGAIHVGTLYEDNQILIMYNSEAFNIPSEILNSKIIYSVYSKQNTL
jgi:hypothetical protein